MKVLVVGAGGLGTVFATLLAKTGAEVMALVRPSHLEGLQAQGNHLRVEGLLSGEAPVAVVTNGEEAGAVDWLLLMVKTKDTAAALAAAAGCRPQATLSLQNGLAKNRWLADAFGAETVVGGACLVGATYLAPGHAGLTLNAMTWVGEPGGGISPRVAKLSERLNAAGLPATAVEDIAVVEWWKLILLLPGAVITALSRRDYSAMCSHPLLSELFITLTRELVAVARAEGVAVADPPGTPIHPVMWADSAPAEALAGLRQVGERYKAGGQQVYPSMAQDVLSERRTEGEDLIGEVIRRAAAHEVPVSALDTCYRLIRGLEDGFAG